MAIGSTCISGSGRLENVRNWLDSVRFKNRIKN